jgi:hypothetical protein
MFQICLFRPKANHQKISTKNHLLNPLLGRGLIAKLMWRTKSPFDSGTVPGKIVTRLSFPPWPLLSPLQILPALPNSYNVSPFKLLHFELPKPLRGPLCMEKNNSASKAISASSSILHLNARISIKDISRQFLIA